MKGLEEIISKWGYIGVFLGTFLEGEVTMVVSGFLASQDVMDIRMVLLVGGMGGFLGDQFFFLLGRLSNTLNLLQRLNRSVRYRKARRIVRRYGSYIALFSRYLVGMRMALSFTLGVMRMPFRQFTLLNFISAVLWAITVGFMGYLMGTVALKVLGHVKKYEELLILLTVVIVAVSFCIKLLIKRWEEAKL